MRLKIVFLMLFVWSIFWFCVTKTSHFSRDILVKVEKSTHDTLFDFPILNEIVKEPLSYIGNGLEAIAFVSKDDQYVVKFFIKKPVIKKRFFRPKKRIKQIFSKKNSFEPKKESIKRYTEAFKKIPEVTGVLAVHFNESSEKLPFCRLVDYRGKKHKIDLNEVAFIVQKKAKIISPNMSKEEFQNIDQKLRKLFSQIASKGFVNLSPLFNPENFAILGDEAIMIDLGKLNFEPENSFEKEERMLNSRYLRWIKKLKIDVN